MLAIDGSVTVFAPPDGEVTRLVAPSVMIVVAVTERIISSAVPNGAALVAIGVTSEY